MKDYVVCGNCSSTFYMTQFDRYLKHKESKCHVYHGNHNLQETSCFHCSAIFTTCDELVEHFSSFHNITLTKTITTTGYNIEEINSKNYPIGGSSIQHVQPQVSPQTTSVEIQSLDVSTQIGDYETLPMEEESAPKELLRPTIDIEPIVTREKCCLEEDGAEMCDASTICPLLEYRWKGSSPDEHRLQYSVDTMSYQPNTELTPLSPSNSPTPFSADDSSKYHHETMMKPTGYGDSLSSLSRDGKATKPPRPLLKYQCSQCNERFSQKVHMKKHVLMYHKSDEKPFRCDQHGCSYAAVDRSHLTVHKRKHTGEKPFGCPVCDYKSTQNCALKYHIKRKHPKFSIECLICRKLFITKTELVKHNQACTV